ncbi:acyltransferase [Parabacteroides sp. OttesenSCG-928-N08]|nr:acyltransferase [Parabacteroides sp. OttesenSCG-928-N08]
MAREKNLHIETLRGLSILLIVMGHVIGSTPEGGMQIDYPSPWRYFYLCSIFIRLPLITAIAGWVYALKPVTAERAGAFVKNKFYRLLIPMFVVAALYYIMQIIIPGTNKSESISEIWRLFLFPYTYFWYLFSLFVIMLFILVIDLNGWASTFKRWSLCLVAALLLAVAEKTIIPYEVPNLFGFKGALLLLPYFIAGVGINRFSSILSDKRYNVAYILMAVIGIVLLQVEWFSSFGDYGILFESLKPLFIIPLLALLFYYMPIFKPLVWVGAFSYTIYLYHGFGTAGGRIILSYLGIENRPVVFLFASAIAILCPVILDRILVRSKPLRFFFLGKK